MTTRMDMRAALRLRLEDAASPPLWNDATLNDAIGEGMAGYGQRAPAEATTTIVASGGESGLAAPATAGRIARVIDPEGTTTPPMAAGDDGDPRAPGQAWRWWDGVLTLARPAAAGTWRIDYRTGRTAPADDATALDIAPGDEEIVLTLALAAALARRAIEDAKRGMASPASGLATAARAEADRLFAARRGAARGGWL